MGLLATGGGGGREVAGEDPFVPVGAVFFHGAADPFAAAIPGNTDTGFAMGSAPMDFGTILPADAAGAGGAAGTARPPPPGAGGGGGGGGGAW